MPTGTTVISAAGLTRFIGSTSRGEQARKCFSRRISRRSAATWSRLSRTSRRVLGVDSSRSIQTR